MDVTKMLELWKEEYEAVEEEILDKGHTKETARRMLLFTHGFMYFCLYELREATEAQHKIVSEILTSIQRYKKFNRLAESLGGE